MSGLAERWDDAERQGATKEATQVAAWIRHIAGLRKEGPHRALMMVAEAIDRGLHWHEWPTATGGGE